MRVVLIMRFFIFLIKQITNISCNNIFNKIHNNSILLAINYLFVRITKLNSAKRICNKILAQMVLNKIICKLIFPVDKILRNYDLPNNDVFYTNDYAVDKFVNWMYEAYKNIACILINEDIGINEYFFFDAFYKAFIVPLESYSLIKIFCNYTSNLLFPFIIIITMVLMAAFLVLLERRVIAAIHRRQGPNRVGKGYLQPIADAIKLLVKENNVPIISRKYVFYTAPCLALTVSLVLCAFLPISTNKVGFESHYSILYYYAFSSLSVLALIIAGWASRSKYPLLGTIRACAAIISYEVVMSLILLIIALITQSAAFTGVLYYQKINGWLFFNAPFLVPIFFIAASAELNRAPFDLTESEAELVAGYNVEYSGLLFAFFILAEYVHVINIGGIMTILFFGGGYIGSINAYGYLNNLLANICIINSDAHNIIYEWNKALSEIQSVCCYYGKYLANRPSIKLFEMFYSSKLLIWSILTYYAGLLVYYTLYMLQFSIVWYITIFVIKVLLFCLVAIITRAITPRYRYDYLIYICWHTYVPVCLVYLFGIMWIIFSKFYI